MCLPSPAAIGSGHSREQTVSQSHATICSSTQTPCALRATSIANGLGQHRAHFEDNVTGWRALVSGSTRHMTWRVLVESRGPVQTERTRTSASAYCSSLPIRSPAPVDGSGSQSAPPKTMQSTGSYRSVRVGVGRGVPPYGDGRLASVRLVPRRAKCQLWLGTSARGLLCGSALGLDRRPVVGMARWVRREGGHSGAAILAARLLWWLLAVQAGGIDAGIHGLLRSAAYQTSLGRIFSGESRRSPTARS